MASGPIMSWEIDGENSGNRVRLYFLGSKITADGDCSHEIKRRLLLGRKVMTNLVKSLVSHVGLFVTPWTVAYHAPLSMGFSRQEYWSGLPFPSPEDLPDPGIDPGLLHCKQTLYRLSHQESPGLESGVINRVSLLGWLK